MEKKRYNNKEKEGMPMECMDIKADRYLCQRVRRLYMEAFPKVERIPWWLLRLNGYRRGIDLQAWVEEEKLCGMTASVTLEQMHFVLFFAVAPEQRGQGVGSRILSVLKQSYPVVALNVEPLLPEASNYSQRLRRFAFYQKNGFWDTGWYVWEVGGKFRVLSTQKQLDVSAYRKIFKKLTFGLWNVKLKEAK